MTKHNILILGSGGREHALASKINESPLLNKLFIAPGNGGTRLLGENVSINIHDFTEVASFIQANDISLLIVGPEDPLVNGIHDYFSEKKEFDHLHVIGPKKQGAKLEGSKAFSKAFMFKHEIPTAKYLKVTKGSVKEGWKFLESLKAPFVLKADGLAAGKGVLIIDDLEQAKRSLKEMLFDDLVGKAGAEVVIEEFLDGIEVSYFAITDGDNYVVLPEAKDYKRIGEADTGLNTGGMGSISPVPFADEAFTGKVIEKIIKPTVNGLKSDGIEYTGFIFFGLIKVEGEPYVIEYNCRMGDPETEVVFPRITSDVVELFLKVKDKELNTYSISSDPDNFACVISVSGGYPGNYEKGKKITGINNVTESTVFHAGTKHTGDSLYTNGGRVLAITSKDSSLEGALSKSYNSLKKIKFDYEYYRKDIGWEFIKKNKRNFL